MILKACKEKEIPNIIEFIDYLETDKNYYLVLELCDCIRLLKYRITF